MRFIRRIPQTEASTVLWREVAFAEVNRLGGNVHYESKLDRSKLEEARRLEPASWTPLVAAALEIVARQDRGSYLGPLFESGLEWFEGEAEVSELGMIKLIRIRAFQAPSPNLVLSEFTAALDSGADTPRDSFATRYRKLRAAFNQHAVKGRPILVATNQCGPFVECEGLTRLCCLYSISREGRDTVEDVRVLVGVGGAAIRWPFFPPL